ncbi:hypothetical protein J6590_098254 [Homalodisca vitripennis]|nr:hypothetical protein J6590_097067 [Homalodisca vitripennis]KAG8324189.1 hypothetical protein J6590_098254 [Homalodisca vitripennis]
MASALERRLEYDKNSQIAPNLTVTWQHRWKEAEHRNPPLVTSFNRGANKKNPYPSERENPVNILGALWPNRNCDAKVLENYRDTPTKVNEGKMRTHAMSTKFTLTGYGQYA